MEENRIYYDETNAFGEELPSLYYIDLSIAYRRNKLYYSGEWAFQVENALGSPSHEGYLYNFKTDNIQELNPVVIVPVISHKMKY